MLEFIDKHKFGLLATFATYIVIFMYFQMDSYTRSWVIEPFHDGSYVESPEEAIELEPDNIEVPQDYDGIIRNLVADANDERKRSYDDYSENKSPEQVANDIKALEQQMKDGIGTHVLTQLNLTQQSTHL